MGATLYLLKYNNYYTRVIKKEEDISGYEPYKIANAIQNVNFSYGNFVDTQQVVNIPDTIIPDYLVVTVDNKIDSRWFVVGADKPTHNQLVLTLHRDLVADNYEVAINADCFIEKATIPSNNNLIFNSEDMTYNQIKQSETVIKDQSNCPWIIIYAAPTTTDDNGNLNTREYGVTGYSSELYPTYIYTSNANWQASDFYKSTQSQTAFNANLISLTFHVKYGSALYVYEIQGSSSRLMTYTDWEEEQKRLYASGVTSVIPVGPTVSQLPSAEVFYNFIKENLNTICDSLRSTVYSNDVFDSLLSANLNEAVGQVMKVEDTNLDIYYKYSVSKYYGGNGFRWWYGTYASTFDSELNNKVDSGSLNIFERFLAPIFGTVTNVAVRSGSFKDQYGTYPNLAFELYIIGDFIKGKVENVTTLIDTFKVSIGPRTHTLDAPYDIFCMPFSDDVKIRTSTSSTVVQSSKSLNFKLANLLINKYGGTNGGIYDVQILPYCPLADSKITVSGGITQIQMEEGTPILDANGNPLGYVGYCKYASFSRSISLNNPIIIQDYKVESECDLYRLNSPNYGASFEFNAAKNGGLTSFNIVCTYKPYNPYIKIFPQWGRLYGNFVTESGDARGLVCAGDFSLTMMTDQWETYENNNKNYNLIFDRQIENMEINNSVQREKEQWQIAAGAISGIAGGAGAGASAGAAGGPIGMLVGGVVGGVAGGAMSIAGGIRDLQLNDKLRNEALDYTKDMFGYQLGNIRALPSTLSKVTAYNIDNKLYPFLEYYTCSEVEKQALKDKIKYNGMTAMVIGKIINFMTEEPSYIKGRLIRPSEQYPFNDDYHLLNALADELYKGVFI